jgi:hypothetical protein
MLVPDHLDGNRLNNDPANLVPACTPCNVMRGRADKVLDGETFIQVGTSRQRAEKRICQWCKQDFLVRTANMKNKQGAGTYCSGSCRQSAAMSRKHGHAPDTLFGFKKSGERFKAERRICEQCAQEFLFPVYMTGFSPGRFCSRICTFNYNKAHGKMMGRLKKANKDCLLLIPE